MEFVLTGALLTVIVSQALAASPQTLKGVRRGRVRVRIVSRLVGGGRVTTLRTFRTWRR